MVITDDIITIFIPTIRGYIRKTFRKLDVDDATQGALEIILRGRESFVSGTPLQARSWMLKVAHRHCLDQVRSAKVRQTVSMDDADEGVSPPNGLEAVELGEAINFLNQSKRGAALLAYEMDGTASRIKKDRFYARRDLRRAMA